MRHVIHAQYLVCSPLYQDVIKRKYAEDNFYRDSGACSSGANHMCAKISPRPHSACHSHTQTSKSTHSSHAHGTLLDSPAPHFAGADPYKWNVDSHKDMSVTALTMTAPEVSKWTQTLAGSKLQFLFRAYIPPTDNRFSQILVSYTTFQ